MKNAVFLFRSFSNDMKRALFSISFIIAILTILIFNALLILNEISASMWLPQSTALYYFDTFVTEGTFKFVTLTAGVFPSISLFIGDIKFRNLSNLLSRESLNVYLASKVITASISSILTVAIAQLLTFTILICLFPPGSAINYGAGSIIEYMFTCIIIYNCIAAFWAVFALMISAYLPNVFVAITSPLLFFYLFNNTIGLFLPYFLRIGTEGLYINKLFDIAFIVIFYTSICIILGIIFSSRVRRSIANGSII